jgi:fido (protein-threonine AMPylation protein)
MGLVLPYGPGQTPLNEDETEGLLISSITTQQDLNEAEQTNVQDAVQWTLSRKFGVNDILSEGFVRGLHKRISEVR